MATLCWAQLFVSQAEYFWDTDPGKGNGTAVVAADGSFNSVFEQLTKTGIATPGVGLHKLSVRIKDNMGVWGPIFTNVIDVQQNSTSSIMAISQAEYFWDNDPGAGNGTAVLATDGNFNSTYEQLTKTGIALPSNGLHVFNVRIRDNAGVWGPVFKNVINVETPVPSGCWQSLSVGQEHSAGVKADGTLWIWGGNDYGQLGNGTLIGKKTPILVGTATDWKSVSIGFGHTIALKTDGTLWAWGKNDYGQLGDGTTINKSLPIQIGTASDWKSIRASFNQTFAIKSDGTLWSWGYNYYGQLGDGTTTNVLVPAQVGTATNWKSIEPGSLHTFAIKTDGTLWGWGYNYYRQLGDGTQVSRLSPVQIGTATDWKSAAAGGYHSIAVKTNGTLWGWGSNNSGQLGDGTIINKNLPIQIGTETNWLNIAAGNGVTFATKTDGTLWSWGNNSKGLLGNGTTGTTNTTLPTQVGSSSDNMQSFVGESHVLVRTIDGSLKVCGQNTYGQLGNGTNNNTNSFISVDCPSICPPAKQFSTTNVTSSTATISWVAPNPAPNGGYSYLYSTNSVIGGIEGTTSATTENLTNLLPNTTYYWWVASQCGSGYANWEAGGSFTTLSATTTGCWENASLGYNHSVALKNDGTLWTWGNNQYGQLGDGTSTNRNAAIQIGGNDWKKIAAGESHTIAIKTDGTLWTWGSNQHGQLGFGFTVNRIEPTQLGTAADWVSIAGGEYYTLALKSNGTLWAWGLNSSGQLGNNTTNSIGIPTQIGTANDWKVIIAGLKHTIAIKTDGTLWAWGDNSYGQLGDGTIINKLIPTQIGTDTNWKNAGVGNHHTIAIKTDGTLWSWGRNTYGQLGDGTTTNRLVPTQIGTDTDWQNISADRHYSSAGIKTNGTLWAWGDNDFSQLGDGTTIRRLVPTQIGAATDRKIIASNMFNKVVISVNGFLSATGRNDKGQIGDGTNVNKSIFVPVACPSVCYPPSGFLSSNITSTAATISWSAVNPAPSEGYHYMYSTNSVIGGIRDKTLSTTANLTNLLPNTTYYWWVGSNCGSNQPDWMPAGSFKTLPTTATGCWESVSSGSSHSAGIKSDGTLWTWGANGSGQLGDGTTVPKNTPTQVGTGSNWLKVSTGDNHMAAIKTDGTLWTWGGNQQGQLGNGTTISGTVPMQIGTATDWNSVSCGDYFTLGIKSDGTLWAWGYNGNGQLGDGTTINRNVPVQIGTANDWKMVSAGGSHTLAVKINGTLWGWGINDHGRLGDGNSSSTSIVISTPFQIGTATDWKTVSAGGFHSLALKANGTAWSWGANFEGQLGDGTITTNATPTQIGTATDWKYIATNNFNSSVGIKADGTHWAWGRNTFGQLGDGTNIAKLVPTQIGIATDRKMIAAGPYTTLAIDNNGFLSVTGRNDYGQIGDGTIIDKPIFIPIACPTSNLAVAEVSSKADQLKVYPNPVQDILTISYDQKILFVTVYNAAGQLVLTKAINDTKGTIDASGFVSGLYLVKINAVNDFVKTVKVIKR
ncbi:MULTISPECIES: T9SS type A sorting domain-containing protein [unclassified Chryseobacterium]|uniref:RCC1 domain-containing protein n=1 Tax=unclassified Chryseobacterium TaxID=2593645 RepID=UPI0013E96288|nr:MULTISPECIES: T9SS type A sorting domain-containing protein [unclassified Chryseobacterium]